VGGATAAALALGGLAGGLFAEPPAAGSPAASPALPDRALSGVGGVTAETVARLEGEVRARPADADLLVQLGFAYQLRWRESADAGYLPRSEVALRRALRARPGDANALLGLGSLGLIRHEFRSALGYGRRAQRLLPGSARPLGVIADALLELGRYAQGFAAVERMVSLRPGLASYSRVAYVRELTGDVDGAVAAMELALDAAGGQLEPTAWALVELARLERGRGRVGEARRLVRVALRVLPGYPSGRLELARVEASSGDLRRAVGAARRAAAAVPTPQAVALLADLLDRTGARAEARATRRTVEAVERLLRANGVRVDLESTLSRADRGTRPGQTVELARRGRADRPSILGDDALGWALARAGRCDEALHFARRALRLGTRDPLLFFHRGYAEGCAGNVSARRAWYARALALDPEFSVRWAPVARRAVAATDP
jgi:tetratricopeptide (TPR) repeat protein